jgi:ElaB/YqjD/DUF883 family membrane-anchored ribosome-binding protein
LKPRLVIVSSPHSKEPVMETPVNTKPLAESATQFTDRAADSATSAIRSTQNVTNAAFDRMSDKVDSVANQAAPLINRISSQAQAAANKGMDTVRETSAQLKEKALRAQDTTVGYIKDEPVKAMLIAAATGAALMGLIGLMNRSRRDY